jgi:uncharacterized membrane protein (UPF0127 family)
MKNKTTAARMFLFLLILGGLVFPTSLPAGEELSEYGNPFTMVTLGEVKVKAEVVRALEKLYLGLGHRPELPEGRGMLFILPNQVIQYFCMREMQFPIDIIWLASGRVVGITKNMPPEDSQTNYPSPEPVQYVLEVPGGFSDRKGIKTGDKASW